jgi:outer membrane protein TolC
MKRTVHSILTFAFCLLPFALARPAAAQKLTLADALKIAEERSETLAEARAGVDRAKADKIRANSGRLPNINFTASYDRTLASEFSGIFDESSTSEQSGSPASESSEVDFSKLPFGQRNVYRATFSFSQALYNGGRVNAQRKQAEIGIDSATLGTAAALAQLQLEVAKAFYDSALADRLVTIAEAGLSQASAVFDQTKKEFDAGRKPEFELLRAQVARDNQRGQRDCISAFAPAPQNAEAGAARDRRRSRRSVAGGARAVRG